MRLPTCPPRFLPRVRVQQHIPTGVAEYGFKNGPEHKSGDSEGLAALIGLSILGYSIKSYSGVFGFWTSETRSRKSGESRTLKVT